MPDRTRSHVTALVAVLALVAAGSGGAVAAGIAKNAAKNTVTSKSIKNNAVKSKDLKDGSVASVDVQDGSLVSGDIKDDSLSGADVDEASLGTVPNATAVGGVRISPVSVTLTSTAGGVLVLTAGGNNVSFDCEGIGARFVVSRAASGPPVLLTGVMGTGGSTGTALAPGDSVDTQFNDGQFTVGMALPGGASATLAFTGIHEVNAEGANDCFFRGTITRSP